MAMAWPISFGVAPERSVTFGGSDARHRRATADEGNVSSIRSSSGVTSPTLRTSSCRFGGGSGDDGDDDDDDDDGSPFLAVFFVVLVVRGVRMERFPLMRVAKEGMWKGLLRGL